MSTAVLSLASFFSVPTREYEHFTLTYTTAKTITTVVVAVCLGVILAALYNYYVRQVPGGVARLLLSRGALSPDTALNAEELGLLEKPFALWELLRGVSLRHIVCAVTAPEESEQAPAEGEEPQEVQSATAKKKKYAANPEYDAQTRFYIPEARKYRAEIRFEKKGNGAVALVLTCACAIALGVLLIKLIPAVLAIVDGMM